MGTSSNIHASSISATTTPEAITQITQRTRQIPSNKRMEWWKHGKLEELISECEAIQKRLKRSIKTKNNQTRKLSVD